MKISNKKFSNSEFIILRDKEWYDKQKISGTCVALCLKTCKDLIESYLPDLSLKDLERECEKIIKGAGCTETFYLYKGFPGKICCSVNKQLVHGIPTDYILQDGDVVSVDLGATFEGVISDAAITAIYGQANPLHVKMLKTCKGALNAAIEAVKPGRQLGVIGETIYNYVKSSGFGLVTNYGGHGISMTSDGVGIPHSSPFVANKAKSNEGIHIKPGLVIAIEPLLTIGSTETFVGKDGWTVYTKGISCHMEDTIFVTDLGAEIMTI